MPKTNTTVEVASELPGIYHIPGQHNMQQTLCGYVDCAGAEDRDAEEYPCNCGACIGALKSIKALRFPSHYFAKTAN
jgi:hypothetical protein